MKKYKIIPLLTTMILIISSCAVMAKPANRCLPEIPLCYNIEHGWLGVEITDGEIEGLVDIIHGAYITDVLNYSPAYEAGIRPGDLVTEINGIEVRNAKELISELQKTHPGEEVFLRTTLINEKGYYRNVDFDAYLTNTGNKQNLEGVKNANNPSV